jgi:hypothetical protein
MKVYDYQGTPTTIPMVIRANVEMAINDPTPYGGLQQSLDAHYTNTIDTLIEMGAGADHADETSVRGDYVDCVRAVAKKARVSLTYTSYFQQETPAVDVEIAYRLPGNINFQRKTFKSERAARLWLAKMEKRVDGDIETRWRA